MLLFNPRSAKSKPRIPNSILQVAASIDADREWVIVDGNRETDPWQTIKRHFEQGGFRYFGTTVMPGPQLRQAIPIAKKTRELFPDILQIWGGYFASNQHKTVLESGWVDYVVNGPGDIAFPALLNALEANTPKEQIKNLIFLKDGKPFTTAKETLLRQYKLPDLPYHKLDC